jgi:hypothetical protein
VELPDGEIVANWLFQQQAQNTARHLLDARADAIDHTYARHRVGYQPTRSPNSHQNVSDGM